MKLGIGSYTFGWAVGVPGHEPPHPMDEHTLLDAALELQVSLVQIGDNVPLFSFDSDRVERLGARAAQENITLELGGRGLTRENLDAHIALARRLNAPLLRFIIDGPDYTPAPDEIIAILRAIKPQLSDGPFLALENHDRFPAKTLRAIVEAIGSERVGVCLDTANSLGAGEGLSEVAAILAPYTLNLHVKDFSIKRLPYQMGFVVEGRPAGKGMMNLPAVVERLARFRRCRSAVLELWTPPEKTIAATVAEERAWAAESVAYLTPFFA